MTQSHVVYMQPGWSLEVWVSYYYDFITGQAYSVYITSDRELNQKVCTRALMEY